MKRTSRFLPHAVSHDQRSDGTILLRSDYDIGPIVSRTGDWLHHWADASPDQVFLAERSGAGWREDSYVSVLQKVRALAAALVARGLNHETSILIMSGNGIDHGLLSLAGQYAGIPTVPVAEQYSLIPGAHGRLRHALELIRPAMAYVVDAAQYGEALDLDVFDGIEIIASRPQGRVGVTAFDDLLRGDDSVNIDAVFETVTPDTVAKILMTSGSTSAPKGVLTTHRMLCTNQAMITDSLLFLRDRPPVVVDWLPWNHTFGGSHNFNMMLANGGSLYIDDGKPVKGLFERTVENLRLKPGTLCFNVPVGYGMLLDALRADTAFRNGFFADLDMIFYAGASLPQDVWEGFEQLAMETRGEVPLMTSCWGLTETAPATMIQQEPIDRSGVVGVPMTGVTVKLVPDGARYEVRVKGDNVMPGYFRNPDKTADAFDDEGFFLTGDAMTFVDPEDYSKGMRFDGRLSEDFKLQTGTWVRAGQLRLDMLACLGPLAADVVICGAGRSEVGVLVFPNLAVLAQQGYAATAEAGALTNPALLDELYQRLSDHASQVTGSASQVVRGLVLADPPSMAESEITAKGNLNFAQVQKLRAGMVERLYDDTDPASVIVKPG